MADDGEWGEGKKMRNHKNIDMQMRSSFIHYK